MRRTAFCCWKHHRWRGHFTAMLRWDSQFRWHCIPPWRKCWHGCFSCAAGVVEGGLKPEKPKNLPVPKGACFVEKIPEMANLAALLRLPKRCRGHNGSYLRAGPHPDDPVNDGTAAAGVYCWICCLPLISRFIHYGAAGGDVYPAYPRFCRVPRLSCCSPPYCVCH